MDNYPASVAPKLDDGGGVVTPFDEWWGSAQLYFKNVPENIARYWIYEHWGYSPYQFLKSKLYGYFENEWRLDNIFEIKNGLDGFADFPEESIIQGKYLLSLDHYETATYFKAYFSPPQPLIVLDNRDGHVENEYLELGFSVPSEFVLVEGFRRFSISCALYQEGKLKRLPVWVLKRKP